MLRWTRTTILLAALVLVAAAGCGDSSQKGGPQTITVWDYYGSATPIKPAIAAFQRAHPDIHVRYEALDYATMLTKFTTAVSSNTPPDLATLDMTWIPTFAAKGLLANVSQISAGKINGKPIEGQYAKGALDAMRFDGHYVTALYDFDAYALYYRADLLSKEHLPVPTTWAQLRDTAAKLAAAAPKPGKDRLQILPDTFHFAQFLYQAGGDILGPGNHKAAFASPAGVQALTAYRDLLKAGGVYWGADQGDVIAGIKDERIAMFLNGPYMMGQLKSGAPDQKGKWAVAPAPTDGRPASYLGGTGLTIPVNSKHQQAAWELAQYLLRPNQQLDLVKLAGAAPATTAALRSPELTRRDPYFAGPAPFPVFLKALATAHHYPYVAQWQDIDRSVSDAVTAALLGKKSPQQALANAAHEVDGELGG
jgi:multiple sugar transport system substrate-binding protein